MTRVEFHFDFGSPNAYLAHRAIPSIEAGTGAVFDYVPVLLGGVFKLTGNQSPMTAFKDVKNKLDYMNAEMRRFCRRHGIEDFRFNPHFPVNTLMIMRGAAAASIDGGLKPYVEAVYRAVWVDGRKMDDPEVIRATLDEAALDGARVLARAQDQDAKDLLMKNTGDSVARGAFGSPTFFVGEEMFFGKDSLRDVEEEIVRVRA